MWDSLNIKINNENNAPDTMNFAFFVVFLPQMYNPNLIMKKYQTSQTEE